MCCTNTCNSILQWHIKIRKVGEFIGRIKKSEVCVVSEMWASLCPCPNSRMSPAEVVSGRMPATQMPHHYYYITQYMQRLLFPWSVHHSNNHTNLNTRKAFKKMMASKATGNITQLPDLTQMPYFYNCGWFCINADSPRSMRRVLSGCYCYCYCSSAICKWHCKC